MKKIVWLLVFGVLISCNMKKEKNLNIEKQIPDSIESEVNLLISPSQIAKCYKTNINGIEYIISKNEEQTSRLIFTYDKKFATSEGVSVGMKYSEIKNYSDSNLILISGWAYVLPLKSGWNASFEISQYDDNIMSADSVVKWIYGNVSDVEF